MFINKIIAILLLMSSCVDCFGQSERTIHPDMRGIGSNWERYTDAIPVSGNTKVGLVSFADDQKVRPKNFYVYLPDHQYSKLCVEISSRDGKYDAKLLYNVLDLPKGNYRVEMPTRFLDQLAKYTTSELTILAKMTDQCNDQGFFYILSSWNKPPLNTAKLYIHLLVDSPTYIQLELNGSLEKFQCDQIRGPSPRAYNCECVLPVKESGLFKFEIVQKIPKRPAGFQYISLPFPLKL